MLMQPRPHARDETARVPLGAGSRTGQTGRWNRNGLARAGWLKPSVADWIFVTVLTWLFFGAGGATSLLSDGDTGWHIRTGEYVLATGDFPRHDLFSFTMEGRTWFAWEWLADVIFALVHQVAGLKGVSLLGGVVIAATAAALFRYMMWLNVNILLALLGMFLACSASTLHWLSRPHMYTWGLLILTVWLLEADRREPTRRVYWLVPLGIVWTNLHGGFVALLVTLLIYAVGGAAEDLWARYESRQAWSWRLPDPLKRYGLLFILCTAGTIVNPYTYELHLHILGYLGSDFILNNVQEFQSPNFRGESMLVFEVFLVLGTLLAARMLWRKQVTSALLLLAWAHASLTSVRHMPLFMIIAVPLVTRELTLLFEEYADRGNSWLEAIREMARDYSSGAASERGPFVISWLGISGMIAMGLILNARAGQTNWTAEFPRMQFPALACDTLDEQLQGRRVLSTDQWGDYLIYRFYPNTSVFIDGRSDFYDPAVRDDYVNLLGAHWGWKQVLDKYRFDGALIPVSWSLAAAMKIDRNWRLRYDDGTALFFERIP
jgi:hypothetical protein